MAGTFVPLGYFLPTNLALLNPSFPAGAVVETLTTWSRWNWVRTGLGVAAAAMACNAMITGLSRSAAPGEEDGR